MRHALAAVNLKPQIMGITRFVLLSVLAITGFGIGAQGAEIRGILADDVRARVAPSTAAEIIIVLNRGDTVYFVGESKQTETIQGRSGRWVQVALPVPSHALGWVFGPLLGDASHSVYHHFRAARALEDQNPGAASATYRKIIAEFPKQKRLRRIKPLHGLGKPNSALTFWTASLLNLMGLLQLWNCEPLSRQPSSLETVQSSSNWPAAKLPAAQDQPHLSSSGMMA